jgi:hypothetical protein
MNEWGHLEIRKDGRISFKAERCGVVALKIESDCVSDIILQLLECAALGYDRSADAVGGIDLVLPRNVKLND